MESYIYNSPTADDDVKKIGLTIKVPEDLDVTELTSFIMRQINELQDSLSNDYMLEATVNVPHEVSSAIERPAILWASIFGQLPRVAKGVVNIM